MDSRAPEADFLFALRYGAEAARLLSECAGLAAVATMPASFEDAPEEVFV